MQPKFSQVCYYGFKYFIENLLPFANFRFIFICMGWKNIPSYTIIIIKIVIKISSITVILTCPMSSVHRHKLLLNSRTWDSNILNNWLSSPLQLNFKLKLILEVTPPLPSLICIELDNLGYDRIQIFSIQFFTKSCWYKFQFEPE